MTYRNTASFGKRQEYVVIAELLKREPHMLYTPGFEKYLNNFDILNEYKG